VRWGCVVLRAMSRGVLFRRVRPLLILEDCNDRSPRDDMSCMGRKLLSLQILKS
jgi:hypothetical protein